MSGSGRRAKRRTGRRPGGEEPANGSDKAPQFPPPRKNKTLLAVSAALFSLWLLALLALAACC